MMTTSSRSLDDHHNPKHETEMSALGVEESPIALTERMEKMKLQSQRRSSRRVRQNSHQGGGGLFTFFDAPTGDDDTPDTAEPDTTKPDLKLSRSEQRRLRLEQMRRSRTSSISSVGSSTIPTLDEESSNPTNSDCSSPTEQDPVETAS